MLIFLVASTAVAAFLSLFFSAALLAHFFTARRVYPHLTDRISLRLVALLSLVYFFLAAVKLYQLVATPDLCQCTILAFVYLVQSAVLLTGAIALNTQIVLWKEESTQRLEKWYYIASMFLPSISVTLLYRNSGWSSHDSECWFDVQDVTEKWTVFLGWIPMALLYAVIVMLVSLYRLDGVDLAPKSVVRRVTVGGLSVRQSINRPRDAVHVLAHIAKYPMVCVVPLCLLLVDCAVEDVYESIFALRMLASTSIALLGVLNFGFYCLDPGVALIANEFRIDALAWHRKSRDKSILAGIGRWLVQILFVLPHKVRRKSLLYFFFSAHLTASGHQFCKQFSLHVSFVLGFHSSSV